MPVRVRVLGRLAIDGGRRPSPRDATVLAALVVHQGRTAPVEVLADAVWGESVPASWRKVLQGAVLRLRQHLGTGAIVTEPNGYRLALGRDEVDAWAFEDGVARAESMLSAGDGATGDRILADALALWGDGPYPELADWLPASAETVRLVELRLLAEERQVEARLAQGGHRDAVPMAAALAEREPLREQRWLVLSTALYRSGRQAEALRAINRARRHLADELGLDLGTDLTRLEQAMLGHDSSLDAPVGIDSGAGDRALDRSLGLPSPYKGLAAYEEADHGLFHGRDPELAVCRDRLAETGALLLVARSGHGKSSLVRAGLVPSLRAEGRSVVVVRLGEEPLASLEGALLGQPDETILVVDQAEELFTLVDDESVREAVAAVLLQQLALGGLVVVLRADHVGSLALLPDLARALERSSYVLGAMTEDGLRDAIDEPARRQGCRVEPGLVEVLVQEARGHPGALPLLSHALHETWVRREAGTLTLAGYRATGGIQGALARTAEAVYDQLDAGDRRGLRDLLLRMVALDDEGEPTGRTLDRRTVAGDAGAQRVLTLLVRSRLVSAVRDGYVLAHESLVRSWPRLADWLRDDEVAARMLVDLSRAATQWDDDGRHPAGLLRGPRLHLAASLAQERALGIGGLEQAFLEESLSADELDRSALAAQAERERRANRRLRRTLAVTGVLLVALLVAAAVAVSGNLDARSARDRATSAARVALVQELVSRSAGEDDRSLRALLAVAALDADPGPVSRDALFSLFTDDPGFEGFVALSTGRPVRAAAYLPGGTGLVVADDRADLHRIDLGAGPTGSFLLAEAPNDRADPLVAVAPVTGVVVMAARDTATTQRGVLVASDADSGSPEFPELGLDFVPGALAVSPDGRLAAVSGGTAGAVVVVDLLDGQVVRELALPRPATLTRAVARSAGLAFVRADRLVVGSEGGQVRIVDPRQGAVLDVLDGPPRTSEFAIWTDGRTAVTSGTDGLVRWDLGTGQPIWPQPAALQCLGVAVVESLGRIECSTPGGQVALVDFDTGTVSGARAPVTAEPMSALVTSGEGDLLAAIGGETGRVALWRLDGSGPITHLVPGRFDALAGYEPRGDRLLVAVDDRDAGAGTGDGDRGTMNRDHVVMEGSGALVPEPDDAIASAWIDTARLLVVRLDFSLAVIDLDTERELATGPPLDIVASGAALDLGARRILLFDPLGRVRALDTDTLDPVDPTVDLNRRTSVVSPGSTGTMAVVDADGVSMVDDGSGAMLAGPTAGVRRLVTGHGATVVVGRDDGTVGFLDAATLEAAGADVPGAYGAVRALDVSADDRWLAIQSGDDLVQLVDLEARALVGGALDAHGSERGSGEHAIALRPDGLEVAVRTAEGVARWSLDPEVWREAACALAGRGFTAEEAARYDNLGPQAAATCVRG